MIITEHNTKKYRLSKIITGNVLKNPKFNTLQKLIKMGEIDNVIKHTLVIYSAIVQFEAYLSDTREIIMDEYVSPVLEYFSKFSSKTFGDLIPNLRIFTFYLQNEDIYLSKPVGGFTTGL